MLAAVLAVVPLAFLDLYKGLAVVLALFPFLVGIGPTVVWQEQVFAGLFMGWVVSWALRSFASQRSRARLPHMVASPALLTGGLLVCAAALGLLRGAPALDVLRDLSQFAGYLCIVPVCTAVHNRRQALWLLGGLLLIGTVSYAWNTAYWVSIKYHLPWPGWPTLSVGASYIGPFIGAVWAVPLLKTRPLTRMLVGMAIGALVVLAVASGYRSRVLEVVALTCVSFIAVWVSDRKRRSRVTLVGCLLVAYVGVVVFGTVLGGFEGPGLGASRGVLVSLTNPKALLADPSVQGRLVEAQAAINAFLQHPLFGVGLGHHVKMEWAYQRWWDTAFSQHIWVTEMLMKFGIVGSLLFLWLFVSVVRYALRVARGVSDNLWKAITVGVAIWVVVSLVPTVGSFGDRGFNFVLAVMIGVLSVVCQTRGERAAPTSEQGGRGADG